MAYCHDALDFDMASGHITTHGLRPYFIERQSWNQKPPSDTCDKFILRFNVDGLRKQLKVRAAENERTLNAEILYLIKRGLAAEQQPQGAAA